MTKILQGSLILQNFTFSRLLLVFETAALVYKLEEYINAHSVWQVYNWVWYSRDTQIFGKSWSHLKTLCAKRIKWESFTLKTHKSKVPLCSFIPNESSLYFTGLLRNLPNESDRTGLPKLQTSLLFFRISFQKVCPFSISDIISTFWIVEP